jgi:RNA polymerase sigma-70 factor, ECF subfamily
MIAQSDKALLTRFREGDTTAFTALYDNYKQRLFAYSYRMIPNHQSAEEIVQTTFIKAYGSLQSLQNPELFHHWLFSIARNEVYTFLRRKYSNDSMQSIESEDVMSRDETPLESLVRDETLQLLQGSINQLNPEYREVLILRHYEKLSYVEIGEITGDSVSSVESRLFKARKALAQKMGPHL